MEHNITTPIPPPITDCEFSVPLKAVICTLLVIVSLASIIENILVCLVVRYNTIFHRISMVLIVNLSVVDIIISLFLPASEFGHIYLYPGWIFGKGGSFFTKGVWMSSIVLPFTTVLAITIERCARFTENKLVKDMYSSWKNIKKLLAGLWIYSLVWVGALVANATQTEDHLITPSLYYFFLGFHIFVPLIIMVLLYAKIYKEVNRLQQNYNTATEIRLDLKVTKTIQYQITT